MKQEAFFTRMVFALAFTAIVIGFSAFSQKPQKGSRDSFRKEQLSKDNDTSASGKRNRDRTDWNFDKLEEQMKQLDLQMKNLDHQMKKLDMSEFQIEADEAIKKIDSEKIAEQVDEAMKNIDWENINNNVAKNVKVNKLKMVEVKKEMEQVKANLEKQKAHIKINTGKIKENIEKAMKNAKISMEGAREELRNMKEFTDELEKDGLIDKSKAYKIAVKEGELYIDGKKQSKQISDKYRHYYRKSDFTIDMSAGDDIRI
ncbi:MAG TPA: hypothetical protein VKA92_11090 [Segetibacter sp.]|nr:hypothetical protein [Segetibacter sp.]